MDYSGAARQVAALELHQAAQTCLAAMRARTDPSLLNSVAGSNPEFALGLEMHAGAPTLLLMAKAEGDFLPQQVTRTEVDEFTGDEVKLASVAAAVTKMLLQDIALEARTQTVRLLKAGDAYLLLYVRPEPFEAALALHAGIEITELARIAGEQARPTLQ